MTNNAQANYINQLANLAEGLSKEAAMGVGGQQVIPTQFANPASGMYDPNPANALYSQLSVARSDANAARILDGQVSGTNLLPYRSVLNEAYQTVAAGMNVQMGGGAKSASNEGEISLEDLSDEDFAQLMAETGLFDDPSIVPDKEGWDLITANSMEKAASATNILLADMYNSGVLHNKVPHLVPYIEAAFAEAERQ